MSKKLYCFFVLIFCTSVLVAQNKLQRPNFIVFVADDLSPTLNCYGDSVVATPGIDAVAKRGVLFQKAFCTSPSCTPSRASMLTGRYPHQLAEGANLWGTLPKRFPNMVGILEANGYRVGITGKGWGPGNFEAGGYTRNPAGPSFSSFETFLDSIPKGQPFFFWLGSLDPHRPYNKDLTRNTHMQPAKLTVPPFLPDTDVVRNDLLDYYAEAKRFDQIVERTVAYLLKTGQMENTIIIITSDNGMPFPRAKANLYDAGTHLPLIISGGSFPKGTRVPDLVSLIDLAPTVLEQAGLARAPGMEGSSLIRFVNQQKAHGQPVFFERERHAYVRKDILGYPMRGIRTNEFLYIQNLRPERWPAGDSVKVGYLGAYGDIDGGPAKQFLLAHKYEKQYEALVRLSIAKRPREELYDLTKDPYQLNNVAGNDNYRKIKENLSTRLQNWRKKTTDPRLAPGNDEFDKYIFYNDIK